MTLDKTGTEADTATFEVVDEVPGQATEAPAEPTTPAEVTNSVYYPTSSSSFSNNEVIYSDANLSVTSVWGVSSTRIENSGYQIDGFGEGYQLILRKDGSNISANIGDVSADYTYIY